MAQQLFIAPLDLLKIYPKELSVPASCYKKLQSLKKYIGKQPHQHITVDELAQWEGVEPQQIQQLIA